jgi:transposase-like protein
MKPKTLQQAIRHFSDEQTCIDTVAAMRWPDGKPQCPACANREHYYLKTQKRWKCKECGRQFSVKLGTIFEDSPVSLDKWLVALWMVANCRNGVSSYEVSRALAVTQKTAWFMLHRIRLAMKGTLDGKAGGSGGEVEIDETYIGGKLRNMHRDKKARYEKRGGWHGKAAVMGILDRNARKMRAQVVPHVRRDVLQAQILKHVDKSSAVFTDNLTSYDHLAKEGYVHEIVNHAQEYVKGRVHTNGMENFWSLLKRGLNGTYVAVEPFHLERYVDEQVYRFNNRKDADGKPVPDSQRFETLLSQVAGKRLTYAEVTGKVGQASN